MIDHLVRDLQVLRKADVLIAKIWMNVLLRRSGLIAFAALTQLYQLAAKSEQNQRQRPESLHYTGWVTARACFPAGAVTRAISS
jgi:hypothetical protein